PSPNICDHIPFETTMFGGLLKSIVEVEVGVKTPKVMSVPSPVKLKIKIPGWLVGVRLPVPSKLPLSEIVEAWTGVTHTAMAPINPATIPMTLPSAFKFVLKTESKGKRGVERK